MDTPISPASLHTILFGLIALHTIILGISAIRTNILNELQIKRIKTFELSESKTISPAIKDIIFVKIADSKDILDKNVNKILLYFKLSIPIWVIGIANVMFYEAILDDYAYIPFIIGIIAIIILLILWWCNTYLLVGINKIPLTLGEDIDRLFITGIYKLP